MMDAQDLGQGNVVTNDLPNLGGGGGGGNNNNNNNSGGGGGGGGGRKNFNNNRNFGGNNQVSAAFINSKRYDLLKPIYDLLHSNNTYLLKCLFLRTPETKNVFNCVSSRFGAQFNLCIFLLFQRN